MASYPGVRDFDTAYAVTLLDQPGLIQWRYMYVRTPYSVPTSYVEICIPQSLPTLGARKARLCRDGSHSPDQRCGAQKEPRKR
jgi:hypothetical protein